MRAIRAIRAAANGVELLEQRQLLSSIQLAAELYPGTSFSAIGQIVTLGGKLYIQSWNSELFVSGGTQATTSIVKEFTGTDTTIGNLIATSTRLFMQGTTTGSTSHDLWASDGSLAGTADITPASLASDEGSHLAFGAKLFFAGKAQGSSDITAWISDGTAGGTQQLTTASLVASIAPVMMQGYLYFVAGTSGAYQVYRTDGTVAGTSAVFNIPTLFCNELGTTGTRVIVSLPSQIWSLDAAGGATQISSIFDAEHLTTWNGIVYFSGCRGGLSSEGWELWRTDGTTMGTYILKDIYAGNTLSSFPQQFVPAESWIYFLANTADEGTEWWLTDGTAGGTRMAGSFAAGTTGVNVSAIMQWQSAVIGDTVYFSNDVPNYGEELCQTDGTQAGTGMVQNLKGTGTEAWVGSWPEVITAVGSTLYFQASDDTTSNELFKYSPNVMATVNGTVVYDANHNSVADAGEAGISGVVVYDDANNNGVLDAGETSTSTDASGNYSLSLAHGQAYIRAVAPNGMVQSLPAGGAAVGANLRSGQVLGGVVFGLYTNTPPTVTLPASFNVNEGQTGVLSATASDAETTVAGYQWDLNYDGTFDVTSTSATPSFDATGIDGPATRVVAVRVVDDAGAFSDVATSTVHIVNVAPTATFNVPTVVVVGSAASVSFTNVADSAAADVPSLTYSYDFDNDGTYEVVNSPMASAVIPASYLSAAGVLSVRGTVSDDDGGSTSYVMPISVRDITLTSTSIAEHVPPSSTVGTLSLPGGSAPVSYSLVAGTGSDDNARFQIVGAQLLIRISPDYATKSSFSIRVRATDASKMAVEKQFTISILDVNEAPTGISLSNASIAENLSAGAIVGTLSASDPDAGDSATFALISGTGGEGNASFYIVGNQELATAKPFNYEGQKTYSILVEVTDGGGLTYDKTFSISVTDVNEPPTALALSNASVAENAAIGTVVGALSSADPDAGDTATYSLANGTGGEDNGLFAIVNGNLVTGASFDFETRNSCSVLVQVADAGGLKLQKAFTISITDVNEPPTSLQLSGNSVAENQPAGTVVGSLSSADPDAGDSVSYAFVTGDGSADNASFQIVGNQLQTASSFDYEQKNSYSIRVRATDSKGLYTEQAFVVSVTDVADSPTPWVIDGTAGNDVITLDLDAASYRLTYNGVVSEKLTNTVSSITINGGDGNDIITVSSTILAGVTINGGLGSDSLTGGGGRDLIIGGAGMDTINGGGGADTLLGSNGRDVISGGAGSDSIVGGGGADTLYGNVGADTIMGSGGGDLVYGGGGLDSISGGAGDDTIYGGAGGDTIVGGMGNDIVYGGGGDDWIYVDDGPVISYHDVVYGGVGTNHVDHDSGDAVFDYYVEIL